LHNHEFVGFFLKNVEIYQRFKQFILYNHEFVAFFLKRDKSNSRKPIKYLTR